jgi:hypothetical protein
VSLANKIKEKPNLIVYLFLIIIGLIIVVGTMFQYFEQKDISENKKTTKGEIIEIDHLTSASYTLRYKYEVNGKEYFNNIGINFFRCDNGKDGCIGSEFTVYYSSKNPQHSRIDLGKYEKFKTTVEFVK